MLVSVTHCSLVRTHSRVPPLLHAIIQVGLVRHRARDDQEAHAGQTQGDQGGVAQTYARPRRGNRSLGEADAAGHPNYYAVSGNHPSMWWFCNQVRRLWLRTLRRRSQKANLTWERFIRLVDRFFRQSRHYTRCPVTVSTPKPQGGARCVSSARQDLCGGRGAILVPTATLTTSVAILD